MAMSKKKSCAWFVCPQWAELMSEYYSSDAEASRSLKADPKLLAKLRSGTPVAKSTLLKMLDRLDKQHRLQTAVSSLIVETRSP
jgi:hypothetical protein